MTEKDDISIAKKCNAYRGTMHTRCISKSWYSIPKSNRHTRCFKGESYYYRYRKIRHLGKNFRNAMEYRITPVIYTPLGRTWRFGNTSGWRSRNIFIKQRSTPELISLEPVLRKRSRNSWNLGKSKQ